MFTEINQKRWKVDFMYITRNLNHVFKIIFALLYQNKININTTAVYL